MNSEISVIVPHRLEVSCLTNLVVKGIFRHRICEVRFDRAELTGRLVAGADEFMIPISVIVGPGCPLGPAKVELIDVKGSCIKPSDEFQLEVFAAQDTTSFRGIGWELL